MFFSDFLQQLRNLQVENYVGIEDFVDKLHFLITVILLVIFAILVTIKQYALKPIACFVANAPSGHGFEGFSEAACWVKGLVPFTKEMEDLTITYNRINSMDKFYYYHWVPYILGVQAILFYLPHFFWHLLASHITGTNPNHLLSLAVQARTTEKSDRRTELVKEIARSLLHTVKKCTIRKKNSKSTFLVLRTNCLICFYLLTKILYIGNAFGQILLMQSFFTKGSTYKHYGYDVLVDMAKGKSWRDTLLFPREGFCTLKTFENTHYNKRVAHCMLPVNVLNEIIFVFLWWWFCLLIVFSALSFVLWCGRAFFTLRREAKSNFVLYLLNKGVQEYKMDLYKEVAHRIDSVYDGNGNNSESLQTSILINGYKSRVDEFQRFSNNIKKRIRNPDHGFILKMLQINAGEFIASAVVKTMILEHMKMQKYHKENGVTDDDESSHEDMDLPNLSPKRRSSTNIMIDSNSNNNTDPMTESTHSLIAS